MVVFLFLSMVIIEPSGCPKNTLSTIFIKSPVSKTPGNCFNWKFNSVGFSIKPKSTSKIKNPLSVI